ncbi:outer membrane biogenesis protein BamB [Pseudobythopirellula maris]|uniref:Outer membrane biogenesis protein BamB n=1 Tax=Pseudobythopirellula maris TaxID=2527991 RepID=A0A5C5ZS88_9BACT|nr:outer membrane biogenesis protein BamB [Pseudobythopirellula maris]
MGLLAAAAAGTAGSLPCFSPTAYAGRHAAAASEDELSELYYGSQLPTDRNASRSLTVARDLIAQQKPSEATPLLLSLLRRREDCLTADSASAKSVKSEAAALLASLEGGGRRAYEALAEAEAGRRLSKAYAEGDRAAVAAIARELPSLEASRLAWLAWSRLAAEHGCYQTAALVLERALDAESFADEERQQLALQLASLWVRSGDAARATDSLKRFGVKGPAIDSFAPNAIAGAPVDWLSQQTDRATERWLETGAARNWVTGGGGPRRNPRSRAGLPHVWPRWAARLDVDGKGPDETLLKEARRKGGVLSPVLGATVFGELVAARTPGGLVAFDFASGKRLWESRDPIASGDSSEMSAAVRSETLVESNRVAGGVSTNGDLLYVVSSLSAPAPEKTLWRNVVQNRMQRSGQARGNRLVAYDPRSEGKIAWSLGGEGTEGPLAEAFFLSAPLPIEDRLWVLAELQQTVVLLELDAATGEPLWRQTLVGVEQGVKSNASLRLLGAEPSIAGDLVVCPTGSGVVVAIDRLTRTIAWSTRLPVDPDEVRPGPPRSLRQGRREGLHSLDRDAWRHSRAVVEGDRVVVASHESQQLHGVELATGRMVWSRPYLKGHLMAAAANQVAVFATQDSLVACQLSDGAVAWRVDLDAPPAGAGLVAGDMFYQPLVGGRLQRVSLDGGEAAEAVSLAEAGQAGALIHHRNGFLLCGDDRLVLYDKAAPLLAEARDRLAAHPGDAWALCVLGEAMGGERPQRVDQYRAALDASTGDQRARLRLAESLVAMARDPAQLDPLQARLIDDLGDWALPQGFADLHRLRLALEKGDVRQAWELVEGMTAAAHDPLIETPEGITVRRSLWAKARLAGLLASTDQDHPTSSLEQPRSEPALFPPPHDESALPAERLTSAQDAADRNAYSLWSLRQVHASVEVDPDWESPESQRRQNQNRPSQRLTPFTLTSGSGAPPTMWGVLGQRNSGSVLVAWNEFGELLARKELAAKAPFRHRNSRRPRAPRAAWIAGLLVLQDEAGLAAIEPLGADDAADYRWRLDESDLAAPAELSLAVETTEGVDSAGSAFDLLPVGGSGLIVTRQRDAWRIDPTTGELLWRRRLPSVRGAHAEGERLWIVLKDGSGIVAAIEDGATLGSWSAPAGRPVLWGDGRLASTRSAADSELLTLAPLVLDNDATGAEVVEHSFPQGTLFEPAGPLGVVAIAPDGELSLIDMATGDAQIAARLPLDRAPHSLLVTQRRGVVYIAANLRSEAQHRNEGRQPIGPDEVLSGPLIALDAATGEPLWSAPAVIDGLALLTEPVSTGGVLLLASRHENEEQNRQNDRTRLLVLDAATGRTLLLKTDLPPCGIGLTDYWAQAESGKSERISLRLAGSRVEITTTDYPRPPGPPYAASVEAPPESASRNFNEMLRRAQQFLAPSDMDLEE